MGLLVLPELQYAYEIPGDLILLVGSGASDILFVRNSQVMLM